MDTPNDFSITHARQSPLLDPNEAKCDTTIAQLVHGIDLSFSKDTITDDESTNGDLSDSSK
jgi:hypothetical protein